MFESLNANYILERIEVQPPYFALKDFKLDKSTNTISAVVPIEQFSEMECSPITAAESGRHLAILGSCILSTMNPESGRFFYLANSAVYESTLLSEKIETKQLIGIASGNFTKRREAKAKAQLMTIDKKLLCNLNVNYHVIPEKIFQRLFAKHKKPSIKCAEGFNPYKNIPGFTTLQISENKKNLNTTLNNLLPENCLGHFPMFPSVPIAILSHYLISTSGLLLKKIINKPNLKYHVKKVSLFAPNLCFVGESLSLQISFIKDENNTYTFQGIANADTNKPVGEMTIDLMVIN